MTPKYITETWIEGFIEAALSEDLGSGDHTSLSTIPNDAHAKAQLLVKQEGILAGVYLAKKIFEKVVSDAQLSIHLEDGSPVKPGQTILEITGHAQSILLAERLVLNCMQRMSGVATLTHAYKQAIAHTNAKLLDTRKTTPLIRPLEKWAVLIGGGLNHRYGLFDMILIKDNHIDYAGSLQAAVESADDYVLKNNLDIQIEVETRNLDEVKAALDTKKVHRILLDNMSLTMLRAAVKLIDGRVETEASGGVNLDTIATIAETGVDYISVGALTHSYTSLDLSLKAIR